MYELIEKHDGASGTLAAYARLGEATEAMLERARAVARHPSVRVITQRPRKVVLMDRDGARTTLLLRHAGRTRPGCCSPGTTVVGPPANVPD